jgi:hypothetical protein
MNEHEFERALERGFADMRARRGLCPAAEKLAAFVSGELLEMEAASIRAHVALCGACDGMLVRLREFEEAKAGDVPVDAREERMRTKVFRARRWTSRALAAAGYLVAAGVLVCGYLGLLPRRNMEPAVPSWEAVENFDLNRARGGTSPLLIKASSNPVILSFFVDIRPDLRYEAALDRGQPKSITSYDGVGNFQLVVDRRLLSPGRHVLTVREGNLRTIEFPFEMK